MENENEKIETNIKKKKSNLIIDYSKFQNNFMQQQQSNKKKDDKNKNEKENNNKKNYDQFLNVSDILNDNLSQSSLNENNNKKKSIKKSLFNNINNNNNLDNLSINESDEQNLTLMLSYNDDIKKKNKLFEKKNEENKLASRTVLNSSKKRNYIKFLNKNNLQLDISKTLDNMINFNINKKKNKKSFNDKTSYVKLKENRKIKYNNFINNSKNKYLKDNFNNSIITLSELSNVPSTTTTIDFITGNNTKNIINKSSFINNNRLNNIKSLSILKNNKEIMNKNKNNINNFPPNNSDGSKYYSINDLNILYSNKKNPKKKKKDLFIYLNKDNSSKKDKNNKNDDLIDLLDNIKIKYRNQENEFITQQKNMKSEIEILREKLKKLSINEALYQVEIEKLKRTNNNSNDNNDNNNNKFFGNKLDDIIKKYNENDNTNINNNLYSFSKKTKFENFLDILNLDKNIFLNEFSEDNENEFEYEEIFNKYPLMKKFIESLVKKYKNEKEYRTRLEEKTVEIFTNDMKTINILEKKIKKYEDNNKQFKNNSSLNISLDAGLSDNITKNSCKSCKSCDIK